MDRISVGFGITAQAGPQSLEIERDGQRISLSSELEVRRLHEVLGEWLSHRCARARDTWGVTADDVAQREYDKRWKRQ